ncbi:putative prefoldin subunit 2 [Smittium culicis]|nr:putative prefoldin subunit 2 [Smittium culicis]
MEPLEPERTCFRLINGVLLERSVQEVLPALKTNRDGISKVIAAIMEQYKKKETEFMEFQKKNNIKDGQVSK